MDSSKRTLHKDEHYDAQTPCVFACVKTKVTLQCTNSVCLCECPEMPVLRSCTNSVCKGRCVHKKKPVAVTTIVNFLHGKPMVSFIKCLICIKGEPCVVHKECVPKLVPKPVGKTFTCKAGGPPPTARGEQSYLDNSPFGTVVRRVWHLQKFALW